MNIHRMPRFMWRVMRLPPRAVYALGLGPLLGRHVLLLTTIGRKTGRRHITPLQYEEVDDTLVIMAARGPKTDWFQNIVANPNIEVQVKGQRFDGVGEAVTDPARLADMLRLRLQRHPQMVGAILRAAGLPAQPSREQLEQYAAERAMVIIRRQ